ncbi:MAG: zinc ribbon domain-containing protein [Candidatus Aenigmatarchaeota archaeon]
MPIYEYRCKHCGKVYEVIQKINEEAIKSCIYCGGEVERIISLSSFVLKGSGWYLTDYSEKRKKAEKDQSEKSKESSGKNGEEKK